jgi:peptidoglycan-associated lipoprotein
MQNRGPSRGALLALAFVLAALGGCQTRPSGPQSLTANAPRCADFTVQLYFESQSAALTKEARAVVDDAVRRTRGCQVAAIDVLGLSDANGAAAANLALSDQRAGAVTKALSRRGLPPLAFRVVAAGDAGAVTAAGLDVPLRRRVDVVFHLAAGPKS